MPISPNNQPPINIENHRIGTINEYYWMVYGLGLGSEKPNKIYRGWSEVSLELFNSLEYESYFGLDFGTASPTACVEIKYDGDGTFYVYERLYTPLSEINDSLTLVIENQIPEIKKGKSILVCDSAKDLYLQLLRSADYMAIPAIKGQGSIEVGIGIVQSFNIKYVKTAHLDAEYNGYSYTTDRYDKATDTPHKKDDHLMDALRYVISYTVKYLGIKF